jgi:fucose 4-O-acetylase-like acetyltransferase
VNNVKIRIGWIDSVKGLLLIFITFSHFGYLPPVINLLIIPTGIVWVPCFFFLSGMLFSSGRYAGFSDFFKSKTKTLLVPYICMFILFSILDWNAYINFKVFLNDLLKNIYFGLGPPKANPLWFVMTLYLLNLIYFWIITLMSSNYLKVLAILFFSTIGYLCFKYNVQLPLNLQVTFSALTFLGVGNLLKNYILQWVRFITLNKIISLVLILILFFISHFTAGWNNGGVLGINTINNYFLFYISAFSGIFGIIILIYMLWSLGDKSLNSKWIFNILNYISKNALPILAAQCYIIIIISDLFKYLNKDQKYMQIEFIVMTVLLIYTMYFFVIPFFFNKLYFLFGKDKQTYKSLITIN